MLAARQHALGAERGFAAGLRRGANGGAALGDLARQLVLPGGQIAADDEVGAGRSTREDAPRAAAAPPARGGRARR